MKIQKEIILGWTNIIMSALKDSPEVLQEKSERAEQQKIFSHWPWWSKLPCCREGPVAGNSQWPPGADCLNVTTTRNHWSAHDQWTWKRILSLWWDRSPSEHLECILLGCWVENPGTHAQAPDPQKPWDIKCELPYCTLPVVICYTRIEN